METYDVVIVGSGPAGLMCAVWLARKGVKNIKILEKKSSRPSRGRADGFEPRTLEILKSVGLLHSWWHRANKTVELSVWVSSHKRRLERILRRCNSARGSSDFYEATMDQAVIEQAMEEHLAQEHGIFVQYSTECLSLEVDQARTPSHPITLAAMRRPSSAVDATMIAMKARYLVGADGSRSWTRNQTGIRMLGARTTQYWGVADIVPLSDFPDIRNRCIIHKEDVGTVMTIPRESGMVRLYVQLGESIPTNPSGESLGPQYTITAAQNIMLPFRLDYRTCYWSSYYRVEQTLASSFSAYDRVFLLGDAIHTHSPKAGQGLNVSIQDAYNLGWKLAAVVNGEAHEIILRSYEKERRPVAQFLVDFDKDFQRFFHEPLTRMHWSPEEYRAAVSEAVNVEHAELSGISACFIDDHMFEDPRYNQQELAPGVPTGKRIPNVVVANQADGKGWDVHDLLRSSGSWRLLVFAGDLREKTTVRRYTELGRSLRSPNSPLKAFAPAIDGCTSPVDVLTVHSSPRHEIDLLRLPEVFHPWSNERGWNYDKVFADNETYHEPSGHAYKTFGICPRRGCALLIRPDQHVCMITEVSDAATLATRYLSNWLCERPAHHELSDKNSLKSPEIMARL